jgi:hypothetical protein
MTTHLWAFRAAVLAAVLVVIGCSDRPANPVAGPDPANAAAPAPRVDYRPTLGDYKSQRPVSAGPWREQNEQVTPPPKSGQ